MKEEACSLNLALTASTAAALAMGDALAISLLERRGFKEEDFAALHPGGKLGKRLRRLESLMHAGENLPCVAPGAKMPDVIYEMSRKGLGLAAVVDGDRKLLDIITDGDLRRMMQQRRGRVHLTAAECMSKNPVTLGRGELAASALRVMEEKRITSVLVVDADHRLKKARAHPRSLDPAAFLKPAVGRALQTMDEKHELCLFSQNRRTLAMTKTGSSPSREIPRALPR